MRRWWSPKSKWADEALKSTQNRNEEEESDTIQSRMYAGIGRSIGTHPYKYIIVTIIIVGLLSLALVVMKRQNDLRIGFAPMGGRSRHEFAVYDEYYKSKGNIYGVMVYITASDGGNLLRHDYLHDAHRLSTYVRKELLIDVDSDEFYNNITDSRPFGYQSVCNSRCNLNAELGYFVVSCSLYLCFTLQKYYDMQLKSLAERNQTIADFEITYPRVNARGERLLMASNMFDIELYEDYELRKSQLASNMKSVKIINLWLLMDVPLRLRHYVEKWESYVRENISDSRFSPRLQVTVFGELMAYNEVSAAGSDSTFLIIIGVLLMMIFIVSTTLLTARYRLHITTCMAHVRWILIALSVVLSPTLATVAAMGTFAALQLPFNYIMSITPVLVLAIGVDDAFLIIHAWLRKGSMDTLSEQCASSLKHVGPSMTITSATNSLAFGIGAITTDVPFVRDFCALTALAVALDLIFEFTLFTPSLVLLSDRQKGISQQRYNTPEEKNIEKEVEAQWNAATSLLTYNNVDKSNEIAPSETPSSTHSTVIVDNDENSYRTTTESYDTETEGESYLHKFTRIYAKCLSSWTMLLILIPILVLSYMWSASYIYHMRPTFSPAKSLHDDAQMNRAAHFVSQHVHKYFYPIMVFINSPPRLGNTTEVEMYEEMMSKLESLDNIKPEFTVDWLRRYRQYFTEQEGRWTTGDIKMDSNMLNDFLTDPNLAYYSEFVQIARSNGTYIALRAYTMVMGSNVSDWGERGRLFAAVRNVLDNYTHQFNVTVWDADAHWFDLMSSVGQLTLRSVITTVVCMSLVCALFVNNICSTIVATMTIASITTLLLGSMAFLSDEIDPVVSMNIIMAVGFSVDYTAHVTHQYYASAQVLGYGAHALHSPSTTLSQNRIQYTLLATAWPTLQAAISTSLCVLPLVFYDVYTLTLFVKTVLLVVVFGLSHALIILPVLLAALPNQLTGVK